MDVRLKKPAFLEGSRQPAGALLTDYRGPLADWMEVVETPTAGKGRKRAAD